MILILLLNLHSIGHVIIHGIARNVLVNRFATKRARSPLFPIYRLHLISKPCVYIKNRNSIASRVEELQRHVVAIKIAQTQTSTFFQPSLQYPRLPSPAIALCRHRTTPSTRLAIESHKADFNLSLANSSRIGDGS